MTHVFINPNTRTPNWKEQLLCHNYTSRWSSAPLTYLLVEPDCIVLDAIKASGRGYVLVDPQHYGVEGVNVEHNAGDCATTVAYRIGHLISGPYVVVLPFKVDIDCLAAISILLGASALPNKVNTIQQVDSGAVIQSSTYNPCEVDANTLLLQDATIPGFDGASRVPDTMCLAKMSSDFKVPTQERVDMMSAWLAGGPAPSQYHADILAERMLLLDATSHSECNGIKVVLCQSAGASSLIYRTTTHCGSGQPYGIAYTTNFQQRGATKISVMQYSAGYLNLEGYWDHMNTTYPEPELGTWGGGKNAQGVCCAGGSPVGTVITPEQAAEALTLFVL
jgi:hypothetical protein